MLSVITPVHPPHFKYLQAAYKTLLEQTYEDWEWIIAPQGHLEQNFDSPRVKVCPITLPPGGKYPPIGFLKKYCADRISGDIIVEFDADDLLHPECLREVRAAFDDPLVAMAYSNNALFENESWKPRTFDVSHGWRSRPVMYQGHELQETLHFPIGPQALRSILYSPDHVRAWRRASYEEVGGHDPSIQNGDDHELMCKMYKRFGKQGIKHIERCLYFYRCHEENTCQKHNPDVFSQVDRNYCRYSRDLATQWAEENGYRKIDLGGRFNAWPGYETVDIESEANVICDLNDRWPFEDSSVGVLRASHIFEHLRDPIHTMNEAYRVLAPGGWLFVEVPSSDGRGAFQDPTHVTYWNEHCVTPETLVLCSDMKWRTAGTLREGDLLIAFDELPVDRADPAKGRPRTSRHFRTAVVEKNGMLLKPCYRIRTDRGDDVEASDLHLWLVSRNDGSFDWVSSQELKEGDEIVHIGKPWQFENTRSAGLYEDTHVKMGSTAEGAVVTKIESIGEKQVCGVQTSTRTLITNGYFSHNSFWYYTDQNFARFIKPRYTGRFQSARCVTFFASEFEKQHNIPWVQADLIALKPPYSDHAPGEQRI